MSPVDVAGGEAENKTKAVLFPTICHVGVFRHDSTVRHVAVAQSDSGGSYTGSCGEVDFAVFPFLSGSL